jgi:PPOX class probable F420-dependent enzyme
MPSSTWRRALWIRLSTASKTCKTLAMEEPELRRRFASSPVAHLATVGADGRPHIVPVVFALVENMIFTAVDAKPKRTTRLQRLANIEREPRCSLLVDHYENDWSKLWWVRADGEAAVVEPAEAGKGLSALVARHAQYRQTAPSGPLLGVRVLRWSGWSAGSS